ncbi:alpha/beta fold hydrolase [Pararobbsia alpina]|uniref:alpha/beta fold hydrolase n=1 Tax=Pararobbsia alpina TaxID=621374 RepID=UPI0039A4FB39
METHDDELIRFEADGVSLPASDIHGFVEHDGVRIWYASFGSGKPVILLHGGLGHSGNWGKQIQPLVEAGYRPIAIDSRGHGHSTRDARPYSYERMGTDVIAVMDTLKIEAAPIVGWSDGACTGLLLGEHSPSRATSVLFFGCNMDPSGTKEIQWPHTVIERCFNRHKKDYARLSATPDQFEAFVEAVSLMERTQPNYSAEDLAKIDVPVLIVQSELDEFIKPEHAAYLAETLPYARLVTLPGVSHFAPIQRPEVFNRVLLAFLGEHTSPCA